MRGKLIRYKPKSAVILVLILCMLASTASSTLYSAFNSQAVIAQTVTPMVAAGGYHTLGLKDDGTVVAVGSNQFGQRDVESWDNIAEVAAGEFHTVGLKDDDTVVAAGNNYYGQRDVESWSNIKEVAAGGSHTVGLRNDGTVVATGYNYYGGCAVESWSNVEQVAAGWYHTVGLKEDGTVNATGYNAAGQCDVESWNNNNIVEVAAGGYHTVGRKGDDTVVAIGNNDDGECDVELWYDIKQVAAGYLHTVGLKNDGTVIAVGNNGDGQCDVESWSGIVQVAAGGFHTVGLKYDGTVVATGWDDHGQCTLDWDLIADTVTPSFSLIWPLIGTIDDRDLNPIFQFGTDWLVGVPERWCPPYVTPLLHVAVDIWAPHYILQPNYVGESVYAAESGRVGRAEPRDGDGVVVIDHDGFSTVYWHLDQIYVQESDIKNVERGQKIGTVTYKGNNTHLHFGVRNATYNHDISWLWALAQTEGCRWGYDPKFPEHFIDPQLIDYETAGVVVTATDTGKARLETSAGIMEDLAASNRYKPGVEFPHGLFQFEITGLPPGGTSVDVTITAPGEFPLNTQYWKWGPTWDNRTDHWYEIPVKDNDGDNVIIITLFDGGLGDDDLEPNGIIIDEGGPGWPAGGGATGVPVFPTWYIGIAAALGAGVLAYLYRRRALGRRTSDI